MVKLQRPDKVTGQEGQANSVHASDVSAAKKLIRHHVRTFVRQRRGADECPVRRGADGELVAMRPPDKAEVGHRLIYFQKLFFLAATDGEKLLDYQDVVKLLSFMSLDLSPIKRLLLVKQQANLRPPLGKLDEESFVEMCALGLWDVPLDELTLAFSELRCVHLAAQASRRVQSHHVDRRHRLLLVV